MILINRGAERSLSARCLVTNMSRDPIYIQSVIVRIVAEDGEHKAYITDAEDIRRSGEGSDWKVLTRQGPVQPGAMFDMGSYASVLDYAADVCFGETSFASSKLAQSTRLFEISVLGVYGSEDLLIGASRTFELFRDGSSLEIRVTEALTRQITRRSERRKLALELVENR